MCVCVCTTGVRIGGTWAVCEREHGHTTGHGQEHGALCRSEPLRAGPCAGLLLVRSPPLAFVTLALHCASSCPGGSWSLAVVPRMVTDPWPPIRLPGGPAASICLPPLPQMEACGGFLPGV